MCVSVSDCITY